MPATSLDINYTEDYIESCFYAWYRSGAPSLRIAENKMSAGAVKVIRALEPDSNGKKPTVATLGRWMETRGWRERADALDAQVALKMDKEVVSERIKVFKRLSAAGERLLEKGLEYIEKNPSPFADNPSAAVRAIVSGGEMLNKFSGAADKLSAIQEMSDKQLERAILEMLGTKPNDDNDETVEATLDDVLSADDNPEDNNA